MREGLLAEVGDLGGCQFGFDESELDLLTVGGTTWVNRLCIEWDLWTLGRGTWVDMLCGHALLCCSMAGDEDNYIIIDACVSFCSSLLGG